MPARGSFIFFLFVAVLTTSSLFAQQQQQQQQQQQPPRPQTVPQASSKPGVMSAEEASEMTRGWSFLSQGQIPQAQSKAAEILGAHPHSIAALSLAVEVEIARGGAAAGLARYERWLGQRLLEEPGIVRRLAESILREAAAQTQNANTRLEALRALAADGDKAAIATLTRGGSSPDGPETRALAASGDTKAVDTLVASLDKGSGNPVAVIEALADSRSQTAIAPLAARLKDGSPEVRAAAVTALGKLGHQYSVLDRIKPLLSDQTDYVRVKAAAALYGLGDMSGAAILQELSAAEAPISRLVAAQAMSSRPDAQWLDQVRQLTSASEPEVRVGAATLVAPHDPELARRVLGEAMKDQNPAIREMASDSILETSAHDLRALRHLLRSTRPLERVRAASRILAFVR
jgi:HEAT repeat protein